MRSFYSFTLLAAGALALATLPICLKAKAQTLPCPAVQTQHLMPPCNDPGTFGESVSVVDNRLAVYRYNSAGGRVTTYTFNSETRLWDYESDVSPAGLGPLDAFGLGLALHYDMVHDQWLMASANPYYWDGNIAWSGKMYLYAFDTDSGQWVQQAQFLPDQSVPFGDFGRTVTWATSGARTFLVIGAEGVNLEGVMGSVYIFEQNDQGVWTQTEHLQAPDPSPEDGFGSALSATESNGETILAIGASGHAEQSGEAYLYSFNSVDNDWELDQEIEVSDPWDNNLFGDAVSVAPVMDIPGFTHRAAVGSHNEGGPYFQGNAGAAYLYLRSEDGTWHQEARLVQPGGHQFGMELGNTINLPGNGTPRLLVGAVNDALMGPQSGSAFIYQRNDRTGNWVATQALYGHTVGGYDAFAAALALGNGASDGTAVIGALATECPGGDQWDTVGSVYVFDLDTQDQNGNCPPPVLTLQKTPNCSNGGGRGGEIEVRWFQATPDDHAHVALLFSRRAGTFVVPPGHQCAGLQLGLGSFGLQVAYTGSAGQFGAGRITALVPRAVCGGYLQLIDLTRCAASNVVRIQ